ncbi:MAG: metallophosphoesterase [Bacteroidales bacterium]|jgi:hypothetical protein|nr:metallophosphoesterase [Bacteroidales bacterium]
MYDIIGDVHGHANMLQALLLEMGYSQHNGHFAHPERKAVFVGDFINRGTQNELTINIIRDMTESGCALAILGNHELNAIYFTLRDKDDAPLDRRRLHNADVKRTMQEFSGRRAAWQSHVKWLRRLPLFLDLGDIRAVHACWTDNNIQLLKEQMSEKKLKKSFLRHIAGEESDLACAFWETCRGIDFRLPEDMLIFDEKGQQRRTFRTRWWLHRHGLTFNELSFESRFRLPDYSIPPEIAGESTPYPVDAPPVFFGHYCRFAGPNIVADNLCCVDSGVNRNGPLTAYRWNGEKTLHSYNLVNIAKC